jgi:hypothetical protein
LSWVLLYNLLMSGLTIQRRNADCFT